MHEKMYSSGLDKYKHEYNNKQLYEKTVSWSVWSALRQNPQRAAAREWGLITRLIPHHKLSFLFPSAPMHLPQQRPSKRGRRTVEQTAVLSNHCLKAIQLSWRGCCLHRRVDYEKPHPRYKDWWAGFPFPLWRFVFSIFPCPVWQAQISDPETEWS